MARKPDSKRFVADLVRLSGQRDEHKAATVQVDDNAEKWFARNLRAILDLPGWRFFMLGVVAPTLRRKDNTHTGEHLVVRSHDWTLSWMPPAKVSDHWSGDGEMSLQYSGYNDTRGCQVDGVLRAVALLHENGFCKFPKEWKKIAPLASDVLTLTGGY